VEKYEILPIVFSGYVVNLVRGIFFRERIHQLKVIFLGGEDCLLVLFKFGFHMHASK